MAITINAKGTSYPSYTIGKQGVTIYQGPTDPGAVNEGDVWFDATDGSIKTYTSSVFSPPKVGTLEMDGSTITPDGGTLDITGSLDVTTNITAGTLVLNDSQNTLRKSDTDSYLNLAGGSTTANGGNIMLYGATHATLAGDIKLRSGSTDIFHYDSSSTSTTITGDLTVTGTITGSTSGELRSSANVQTTTAAVTNAITIAIAPGTTITFELKGSAKHDSTNDTFGFTLTGCVKNVGGTSTLVGETYAIEFKDAGASVWEIDAVANDTTDELEIQVTGEASHTIDWDFIIKYITI